MRSVRAHDVMVTQMVKHNYFSYQIPKEIDEKKFIFVLIYFLILLATGKKGVKNRETSRLEIWYFNWSRKGVVETRTQLFSAAVDGFNNKLFMRCV